jgi:hypothetical protein
MVGSKRGVTKVLKLRGMNSGESRTMKIEGHLIRRRCAKIFTDFLRFVYKTVSSKRIKNDMQSYLIVDSLRDSRLFSGHALRS